MRIACLSKLSCINVGQVKSKLRGISPRLTSFVISLLRSKLRGIKPSLGLKILLLFLIDKNLLDTHPKIPGNLKRKYNGRIVSPVFQGTNSLSGHLQRIRQFLLIHTMLFPNFFNAVFHGFPSFLPKPPGTRFRRQARMSVPESLQECKVRFP